MRLSAVASATAATALLLASSASAGLWLYLDASVAPPGGTIDATAVTPCGACGPADLYLVPQANAALQLLHRLPVNNPRFVPIGRFTWRHGGEFTFTVPHVQPGLYTLMALYRNGSAWTAAPASTPLRVERPFGRVSFRTFSIDVPKGWVWRAFPGFEGTGAEFSDWSLAGRQGFSPKALMPPGAFILWINPLGEYGSVTKPTIQRSDFMRPNDPARPRGHARADHAYCAHTGRCFDISFEFGGNYVPGRVLAAVNRALASIRAAPLFRHCH